MKIVCGKCSAEVELPKAGDDPEVRCPSCGAVFRMPSLAEGEELPHPETFPGYRVVAIVGYGGMGTVYRAIQLSMDREVAIKVLLRKYAHVPRFVARFEREASALAVLNHPNIVAVIDRGRVADMYYFVMEYVHGRTLRYLIKNDQLSVERAVDVAMQICQALEAAHGCGVIHRDIKPSNILIQEDGLVKVADFGIVHMVDEAGRAEQERRSRLGTAKYMAPEQRGTGEAIDARADIFGLGVTLFEMLTRELPKGGPPSELNPLAPRELDALIERATRAKREERFQSAAEMRDALEAVHRSMKLEDTSATAVLPVVAPPTLSCPACGEAVPFEERSCPACGAAVSQPCFRAGCDGVDPVGAERCSRCGGHIKLLERQRRAELEAALARAEAQLAAGAFAEALGDLQEVEADPHEAFGDLSGKAREAARRVRHTRFVGRVRLVVKGVAALLIIAAAGAIFWAAEKGIFRRAAKVEEQHAKQPVEQVPATTAVPVRPPPPRTIRRDVFTDYLLALTQETWMRHRPDLRVMAACDAGLVLAGAGNDGQPAQRLARALAEIAQPEGAAHDADVLREHLAAALNALRQRLLKELRARKLVEKDIEEPSARHTKDQGSARRACQRIELATARIYELMAAAELGRKEAPDPATRLLLLDVSLAPPAPQGDLRRAGDRIIRAGRLLVRYLSRDGNGAPELVDDARQRLHQAERTQEEVVRLAYGVEALVEALGACRRPRAGR